MLKALKLTDPGFSKHNSSADCKGGECEAEAQFICSSVYSRWVIFPLSIFSTLLFSQQVVYWLSLCLRRLRRR